MARVGNLKFIPSGGAAGPAMLALDMIPDSIAREVEETYQLIKRANGRIRVQFETEAEANEFALQVDSYCRQRPVDEITFPANQEADEAEWTVKRNGPIRFRKSPSKGLPKTAFDFRITDVQTEDEKATEDVKTAVQAANATQSDAATSKTPPAAGRKR